MIKKLKVNLTLICTVLMVILLSSLVRADVTNSGATTNSQTNTSGSNTTISGGYSAETTNTYQSGKFDPEFLEEVYV